MTRQKAFRNTQFTESLEEAEAHPSDLLLTWLPAAERKPRKREWEKRHPAYMFRGVPPALHAEVKEVAGELGVNVEEVARAFLEYGLLGYARGQVDLEPYFEGKLTLFPPGKTPGWYEAEGAEVQSPRRKKRAKQARPKAWRWPLVAYRLPRALKQQLDALREEKHVPLGEVLAKLMGFALEAYQQGRLQLRARPAQKAELQKEWGA